MARLTIGSASPRPLSAACWPSTTVARRWRPSWAAGAKYARRAPLLAQAEASRWPARPSERDALVNTVDVSVLDQWIDRNEAYDTALRNLYKVISKVGARSRPAIQAAVAAEAAARARLPPDTRGLVIIMADIGRGGMNGASSPSRRRRAS